MLGIPQFAIRVLLGTIVPLIIGFSSAKACQICIPFPKKSAADVLIEADAVVLAREDPERPFHYAPIETLKGDPGVESIELFLDSTTRRLLTAHPDRSIVLAKPKNGKDLAWRRVGTADKDLGPLVREVLKGSVDWKNEPRNRIDFFAKLLGHENPQVSTLAHLEIARAPYSEIRRLRDVLPREEIYQFLGNVRYIEWHALYILLLAQSDDPRDRAFIGESIRSAAKFRSNTRLAAWATATIEIEGETAIDFIETEYFRNAGRKPEELKAVFQALSVHGGGGHVHLRDRTVAAYRTLLENHSSMAPQVVGDLTAWKRKDLAPAITRIVRENPSAFDFKSILILRRYVNEAKKSGADLHSARP